MGENYLYPLGDNNALGKTSGNSLKVKSASASPFDLRIAGNTKQFKSTGKNLLPPFITETTTISNITIEPMADGGIHIYGKTINSSSINLPNSDFSFMSDNKTYTLGYVVNNGGVANIVIRRPGIYGDWCVDCEKPTCYINTSKGASGSSCFQINGFNAGEYLDFFFYPHIEEGKNWTGYEPYTNGTLAPNIDYPISIPRIGSDGNLDIISKIGKNLLPPLITEEQTVYGITFTPMNDGGIHIHGIHNTTGMLKIPGTIPLEKLQYKSKYTFGYLLVNPGNSGSSTVVKAGMQTITLNEENPTNTVKITNLAGNAYFMITPVGGYNNVGLIDMFFYPYIAEESEFSGFEPYMGEETEISIPVTNPLYSLGNTRDEISLKDGYIKRLVLLEFDGSDDEGWSASDTVEMQYSTGTIADLKRSGACICDQYIGSDESSTVAGECFVTSAKCVGVNSNFATLDEFKASLSASPIKVLCELAVPVVTKLTEEQKTALESLELSEYETSISTDSGAILTLEYIKNNDNGRVLASIFNSKE